MNRRNLLIGAGVGAAAVSAAGIWALIRRGRRAELSDADSALLQRVCDLTIPADHTPGAVATQTPAFVALALAHGLGGHDLSLLGRLSNELALAAGRPFNRADAPAQVAALEKVDRDAFAQSAATGEAWRAMKSLIATGYYTSEAGGSQELRYELAPGRFDPDLPVEPATRAFSSDWTSVEFG